MRNFMSVAIVTLGIGVLSLPAARAQDQNDPSTPPSDHVQQHQDVVPSPQGHSSQDQTKSQDQAKPRDQSAQAPQLPGVIPPPSTGDRSVITPPSDGAAKTPVISPPGTPGDNNDVEPK